MQSYLFQFFYQEEIILFFHSWKKNMSPQTLNRKLYRELEQNSPYKLSIWKDLTLFMAICNWMFQILQIIWCQMLGYTLKNSDLKRDKLKTKIINSLHHELSKVPRLTKEAHNRGNISFSWQDGVMLMVTTYS